MTRKRFRREDWLNLGLSRLAEGGPEALKVHDLCAVAERTIGSFYHHFRDINVFHTELGQHWRRTHTEKVIEDIVGTGEPIDQATRLKIVASHRHTLSDLGMRRLGEHRPDIQALVAQVDSERVGFLAESYAKRFGASPDTAKRLAELEYAAFVGTQVIWRQNARDIGAQISQTFDDLVASKFKVQAQGS